jgi:hypothetical protein
MPLICVAPGGCTDPLQQSRKLGVYLRLVDMMGLKRGFELESNIEVIGETLKQEFVTQVRDFLEGKTVRVVRWLPDAEVVSREQSSSPTIRSES